MSGFIIKNLHSDSITVLGTVMNLGAKLDLLTIATGAKIINSMRHGELYEKLQGRMIEVTDITGFKNLGATQDDLDFFTYCGFLQGHLGSDDLKYPFHFTHDGYVIAEIGSIVVPPLAVEIRGDNVVPADRDSILGMGTETGTIAGTVHVLKIGPDGYLQVKDMIADGYLSTLAGTVSGGKVQVNDTVVDGYLNTINNHLDVNLSTRASDANLIIADGYLNTINNHLDVNLSTIASNAALVIADGYLDSIDNHIDVNLSTIASEATLIIADGYLDTLAANSAILVTNSDLADGYLNSINNIPTETIHNYSTSRVDGVAVRLADTTITFTGPTITSNQIRKVIVNTGTAFSLYEQGRVTPLGTTYITISGTTITLAGCGAAPVPAGSTVEVLWAAQDKGYDSSVQAIRVAPVYSDASRSILQDCSQSVAIAGGVTTSYYLDMFGYRGFSIQMYSSAGTYTKTLKLYASNQDDGTAPASCVYNDVSLDWMGTASVVVAAGVVTGAYFLNKPANTFVKYVKIEIVTSAGAVSDNTYVMYARKVY